MHLFFKFKFCPSHSEPIKRVPHGTVAAPSSFFKYAGTHISTAIGHLGRIDPAIWMAPTMPQLPPSRLRGHRAHPSLGATHPPARLWYTSRWHAAPGSRAPARHQTGDEQGRAKNRVGPACQAPPSPAPPTEPRSALYAWRGGVTLEYRQLHKFAPCANFTRRQAVVLPGHCKPTT